MVMQQQRSVGIREVAAHAGVSDSTVSNVINRPELVAPATFERVHASMAELGYVVNAVARHLRLGGGSTLGLILTNIANPFFAELAHDCEVEAENAGYTVLLSSSDGALAREDRYVRMFEEQRVRGLLIDPVADPTAAMQSLADRGMPTVMLGTEGDPSRFCSVVVDDGAGGALGMHHLLERGRRRVVFLGGGAAPVRRRWEGARGVAERADGVSLTWLQSEAQTFDDGFRAAGQLLAGQLPDAVFASNDSLAVGVLHGLLMHGVQVPDRISVVGYDDAHIARQAIVPLTTIRQPRQVLASESIRLVLDHAKKGAQHVHAVVKPQPELVVRQSS
jgi:LacI family transcriptional regulator